MTQTDRKKSEQTLDDLDQCDSKDFALVDIRDVGIVDVDIGDVEIGDVVVLDKSEHEETNKSVAKNEYCLYCCSILNRSGQCSLCGDDSSSKVLEFHPLYLPMGEILAGTYLVGRVLGHGGFGITYLGVDANLGIRVAIKEYIPRDLASRDTITNHVIPYSQKEKQIFEDNLEKFLQEGKMLGRLSHHPNVIPAIRFFKENNTGYLVMPYIEGETLEQISEAQGGTIPLETLLPYMIELLKGLSSLHKQNILHRDIKPPNLYLTQTGQLKILDFGSARLVGNKKQRPLTKEGTPSFAAPEQNDALGEQGAWTDVFGVGATFYVLLTGHIPVDPLYRAGGYMRLPSPAQISPDLIPSTISEIIMKSLELDPQKRFQSAQEFLEQLILSQQDLRKSFMPLPSHVPNHLPSFLSQEHLVQIDSDAKEASSRADNVSESVFFVEDQENDGLLFPDSLHDRPMTSERNIGKNEVFWRFKHDKKMSSIFELPL